MISIITAYYNSSEKINNLIRSLQKQTDKDFEWIVVDDCSRDAEFIAMKEKVLKSGLNVKVIQNEKNGGPGVARNNGIYNCSGSYLTFVDCDDAVSEDFIEILANLVDSENADIIAFDYERVQGSRREQCTKIDHAPQGTVDIDTFLRQAKTCVCGGLFKAELIKRNEIIFPQLYRYEDWVFNVRAVLRADSIWYEKKPLYQYIEAENSLVTSGKHDAGEYAIKAFDIVEPLLINKHMDISEFLYLREILYVNAVSKAARCSASEYRKYMKSLIEKYPNWSKNCYISLLPRHQKIILRFISLKMFGLLRLVLKVV